MADLSILTEAGMDIDSMSAEEQEALGGLDQSELEALAAIKTKLNGGGDVDGFAMKRADTGGFVW